MNLLSPSISKCRLHSVSVTLTLLGTDPVRSAHVTATPLLSLIQPFYLRPVSFRPFLWTPRLHYIKKERGKRNYLGVKVAPQNIKPRLYRPNSLDKLECMDANAATKEMTRSRLRAQGLSAEFA